MPDVHSGAFPIVPFRAPRDAIAWLERAFGARASVHPPDPAEPLVHAEVLIGRGIVMVSDATTAGANPFSMAGPVAVYLVADDPDSLHDRARDAGAEIVMGLTDQPYGSREFAARDPDGNVWCIGTYRPPEPRA